MTEWVPRLARGIDYSQLDLDAEQGFVLSRIDGSTSVEQLGFLTGLPRDKLVEVLSRLIDQGALEAEGAPSELGGGPPPEEPGAAEDESAWGKEGGDSEEDLEEGGEDSVRSALEARNWRRVFEEDLRPLDGGERLRLARQASGDELSALCFDPTPQVVTAVLDNTSTGLAHARLIAEHHRTGSGLDALGKREAFLRDLQVQRHLFRNPQTSDRLVRRILQNKRMAEVYRLALNRDATERLRSKARKEFRDKFAAGTAEERVNLILKCEGRCLNLLIGLALDAKAAALLCQRTFHSTLLIQNLARWPATPPPLLQHMARQTLVKRSPALKNLVLRHPNAPSQLKAEF